MTKAEAIAGIVLVFVGMLALLAGCMTDPVFLRHPKTGEKVQCGPYSAARGPTDETATILERNCIDLYQRQGYERVRE